MRSHERSGAPLPQRGTAHVAGLPPARLIAETFLQLRLKAPRIHCLTNNVAQAFTANLLLAVGAIPSMTVSPDEMAHFVPRSSALLVNLGTLDAERRAALPLALDAAAEHGIPVVLDPVFVDASPPRLEVARGIIERRPAIIRMNGFEFHAIAGIAPNAKHIGEFAQATGASIALTGPVDIVSDGKTTVRIRNGHPLMSQVTAMGCASAALIAALLACCGNPLAASVSGLATLGVAGEIAAETARGPGSFAVAILDALSALDPVRLSARAKIEAESL